MKTSHLVTPRSLSECQFTVGSYDPIVEPSQWIGKTYSSYNDQQVWITRVIYGVAGFFMVLVVGGTIATRFF